GPLGSGDMGAAEHTLDPFGDMPPLETDVLTPQDTATVPSAPPSSPTPSTNRQGEAQTQNGEDSSQDWPRRVKTNKGREFMFPTDLLHRTPPQVLLDALVNEYESPLSATELSDDWPEMTFEERKNVAFNL
uniref:Nucleoprotein n=1 Tax=Dianlovirus menglaense TaxID=3052181 RepID=UPI0028FC33E2|nr:Chain A, Nucleoprotein [Dianlovirus menglaense]8P0Y_O Chain O, Nucleoprotein [Dianlovirus menglaense]8P0Y_P Chain P, Nucleoprotein [Dianlovirus menglaense]8P0Y_Q Chain Q, Nucleoprotein [Dianlovirus menglaense]8P0Y_R Chain R, Nucleoprotein [Dianlovirus menglaense]8P0Y_S Chain S, Nucleoprotein [Dianlovirus menglaense]8P0Y_T Chain T, Nucleoprotein [Dianlovirus menglaense]8P0Y_U Chain U, Nucleoprotein [Dianlovirus menglaense]8P0Y_V Chain V, Nucleoprotein [Dianlovirus menglaense]8P0Y_W Chain